MTLAEALAQHKKKVVTMGGIGTNHGLATAIFCRHLGLACRLLLFNQPVTKYVKQNLLLFQKYGAEMAYYRTMLGTGAMFYTLEKIMNPGAYFLYAGGSSPLGTIGVINGVYELKKQIEEGAMPVPRYIICPLGSNGTMAGLMLGVLLAGLETQVVGVRVSVDSIGPLAIANEASVRALMKQTYRLLRRYSSDVPGLNLPSPLVLHRYFGTGYGCPTEECREALEILRDKENIKLDPTYTAKTFAAVQDFARDPAHRDEAVLYWHTYNSVDLAPEARGVDHRLLPENLRWVMEAPEMPV
jgi:D-cysteine desulfhydrase